MRPASSSRAGRGGRLRRDVRHAPGQHEGAAEPAVKTRVRRGGGVREAQGARRDPRRQHPDGVLVLADFFAANPAALQPLGRNPVGVVGELARIGCRRLQHAQRAAAARQDGADRNRCLEADAQMTRPRFLRLAEAHAVPLRRRVARPEDVSRPVLEGDRCFSRARRLGERLRVEIVGGDRRLERGDRRVGGPAAASEGEDGRRQQENKQGRDFCAQMILFSRSGYNFARRFSLPLSDGEFRKAALPVRTRRAAGFGIGFRRWRGRAEGALSAGGRGLSTALVKPWLSEGEAVGLVRLAERIAVLADILGGESHALTWDWRAAGQALLQIAVPARVARRLAAPWTTPQLAGMVLTPPAGPNSPLDYGFRTPLTTCATAPTIRGWLPATAPASGW